MTYGITLGGTVAFTVVDEDDRTAELGRPTHRSDMIGTPLAKQTFDLVDAIRLADGRLAELHDRASWLEKPKKVGFLRRLFTH